MSRHAENVVFPPHLQVAANPGSLLPNFSRQQIQEFQDTKIDGVSIAGVGIAQAIIEPGPDPRMALFEHRDSGLWGFLSESLEDGEETEVAAERSFAEELKVFDVTDLQLEIPSVRGWVTFPALRRRNPQSYLYGVAFPLFSRQRSLDEVLEQASESDEIKSWRVARISQIMELPDERVRPFLKAGLIALAAEKLLSPETTSPLVQFGSSEQIWTPSVRPKLTIVR